MVAAQMNNMNTFCDANNMEHIELSDEMFICRMKKIQPVKFEKTSSCDEEQANFEPVESNYTQQKK